VNVHSITIRRGDAEHRAQHSKSAKKSNKHLEIQQDKKEFIFNNVTNFLL
jgi:hypothetical protein